MVEGSEACRDGIQKELIEGLAFDASMASCCEAEARSSTCRSKTANCLVLGTGVLSQTACVSPCSNQAYADSLITSIIEVTLV